MKIQQLVLGIYETNCFILSGAVPGRAVVIDPADAGDAIIRLLDSEALVPEAILLTHGHFDHLLAAPALQNRWPSLPVYCHRLDIPAEKEELFMGDVYPTPAALLHLQPIEEGDILSLAGFDIRVLHTPGHTPGSVVYKVDGALFTGDTLFHLSIGRTDFPGGNTEEMYRSLGRLAALEGDYRVFPGHEELSTLDCERQNNPYL